MSTTPISSGFTFMKFVNYSFLTYLLYSIVLSVLWGAYIWYMNGNYIPFAQSTIGLLLSTDHNINNAVTFLSNDNLLTTIDPAFRSQIIFGSQRTIILSVIIFIAFFWLVFKGLVFLGGHWAESEPLGKIIMFFVALGIIFMSQFFFNAFVNNSYEIPMQGMYNLIFVHPEVMAKIDSGTFSTSGMVLNPIDMLNSTSVLQQQGQQLVIS